MIQPMRRVPMSSYWIPPRPCSRPAFVCSTRSLESWQSDKRLKIVQGDHSGCDKPPVDTKAKVAFQYKEHILKHNSCFDVNGRFGPT